MAQLRSLLDRPYLILTLTAVLWAGNAIVGKLAAGHVSPFLLTSLRWTVATAILLPLASKFLRRDASLIRANLVFIFLLGAFGFACFNNLFYLALNYTTSINVAIEQASMPLIVFALNFALFSTRVTRLQVLGFVLTLVGVALTISGGDLTDLASLKINVGDLYMLIAVLLYAVYSVALSRKPDLHWLSFITVLAAAALIASLPFALWEFIAGRMVAPDATGWAAVLYVAIAPAIVAQLFWVRGLELIGSNRGGVFINLVPIFTAIMAVGLLGEKFAAHHAIALALVIAGVWLSQKTAGPQI